MADRLAIVRECFRAYETGDRTLVERHLAPGFAFFSPADPGIGLDAYWRRCWPNARTIGRFELVRTVEAGDEVLVTYEATRADGSRFRNTEVFAFAGDEVARVEVYFGWDLDGES
jgi:ketosteroid isomerase-like protein